MSKNCRFRTTYNKDTSTYTVSFKGLSKSHLMLLRSLFSTLEENGVCLEYFNGISLPYLEVRGIVPLLPSADGCFLSPNYELTELLKPFGNSFGKSNLKFNSLAQRI